jgi:predicted glycosyltransferase
MTGTQSLAPDAAGPCDVLIHVQHLLGIGHLQRAARIAGGCRAAGLAAAIASGGPPVDGLTTGGASLVQLPAASAGDVQFSHLVDADGRPVDDAWRARRRDAALETFARSRPKVLILELFPFGRRSLRFELLPLLEAAAAARPRPWILISLRDLLNPPAADKAHWAVEVAARYADRILVHGDPGVARLEDAFPEAGRVRDRLVYTGYIAPEIPTDAPATGEILVSTGGGAVGGPLAAAAVGARAYSRRAADAPWRVLCGPNLPQAEVDRLAARAGDGAVVERGRPDFLRRLAGCRASVSQAGYNTVTEVLAAGVPGVVVPFAAGGLEREQPLRAQRLEDRGRLVALAEDALTPASLADAVDQALAPDRPDAGPLDLRLDGIRETARLVAELAATPAPRGADRTDATPAHAAGADRR